MSFTPRLVLTSLLLGLIFTPGWAASLAGVVDLAGQPSDPAAAEADVVVLFFTATDCPISNRYAPLVNRLVAQSAYGKFAFYMVYAEPSITPAAIAAHRKAYGYKLPALRDPQQSLTKATGAEVTPEVIVLVRAKTGVKRVMLYRGRIDDQYIDFGQWRAAPSQNDLREVLDDLATGKMPEPRTTSAVGCYIRG